jgi:hypothetical protein
MLRLLDLRRLQEPGLHGAPAQVRLRALVAVPRTGRVMNRTRGRDWALAVPGACGPSYESGSYRGTLRGGNPETQWWRCTGHPPHYDYATAAACASAHRSRLAYQEENCDEH